MNTSRSLAFVVDVQLLVAVVAVVLVADVRAALRAPLRCLEGLEEGGGGPGEGVREGGSTSSRKGVVEGVLN